MPANWVMAGSFVVALRDDKGTKTPTDDTYKTYCDVCTDYGPDLRICDDYEWSQPPKPSGPAVLPEDGVLEQPPTPPPSGPAAPPMVEF